MIPLIPVLNDRGPGGARGPENPAATMTIASSMTSYTHTICVTGGFESCQITMGLTIDEATHWLGRLGASLVVYGPDSQTVWEGLISGVALRAGGETVDLSIEDMYNAVMVRHSLPRGYGNNRTAYATNAASVATYGRREFVHAGSEMEVSEAEYLRDRILAERCLPRSRRTSAAGSGGRGEVEVSLTCMGWWYALDWLHYENADTVNWATASQRFIQAIWAYNLINPFFTLYAGGPYATWPNVIQTTASGPKYCAPDTIYRAYFDALFAMGADGGKRVTYGLKEGTTPFVKVWAGDTPSVISYVRSFGDGRVRTPTGAIVDPWDVRPDAMYQVLDVIDPSMPASAVDTTSTFFLERVTCTVDERGASVRLEPAKTDELDVLLSLMK